MIPVKTLKNALVVLEQRNYCKQQLGIVRDSVSVMSNIIEVQDSMISNLNLQLEIQKKNIENYIKIIENKDKEIKIFKDKYNKEKRYKWYGIGGGAIIAIISFIL